MKRSIASLASAALIAAGLGGYWAAGIGLAPFGPVQQASGAERKAATGPVIYYRDPDGKPAYAESPAKTLDGRDFVAVHASEDIGFDKVQAAAAVAPAAEKRIRFYRNPMGLPDISPAPKKDSMGMDYIPVYEGDEEDGSTVKISPGKLQRTGVRSEQAARRTIATAIRAPGVVQIDERRQSVISLRFDAFIEKVENVTTGSLVRQGEPLMRLYSSSLSTAAAQYVTDLGVRDNTAVADQRGARRRLENLGVPEPIIKDIEKRREGPLAVAWPAPRTGIVTERNAVEGMQAKTGDVLFRIADISAVWLLADVAERDLSLIAIGQTATVKPRGYPGRTFTGKIALIYPSINKETRTARVRIELANPDGVLLPDMYADVEIASGSGEPVIAVPDSAVIDSGTRQVVIVDKGDGRFEPREVKTGRRGDGYTEIREGLTAGDKAVVSANFLIDAESNLKAALQSLAQGDAK